MHKPDHGKDFLKGFFGNKISETRDKQNEAYQNLLKKNKPKKK